MDFSNLNTRAPAEVGAFCHFRHPATGRQMMDDGKPVGAMVRGLESKSVTDAVKASSKAGLTGEDAGMTMAAALIISFVNVERDGKPLPATEEGIRWLFDLSGSFEEQILAFARDRANFFDAKSAA